MPGICELSRTHVDPIYEPIPVVPTCHYMMGGNSTNINGQAFNRIDGTDSIIPGLFAAGEAACVSVHGANRLGGNSLLDLVVFGRATGMFIQEDLKSGGGVKSADKDDIDNALDRLNTLNNSDSGYETAEVEKNSNNVCKIILESLEEANTKKGLDELQEIREKVDQLHLKDKNADTSRVEAIELQNLFEVAEATAIAAYSRDESRVLR